MPLRGTYRRSFVETYHNNLTNGKMHGQYEQNTYTNVLWLNTDVGLVVFFNVFNLWELH